MRSIIAGAFALLMLVPTSGAHACGSIEGLVRLYAVGTKAMQTRVLRSLAGPECGKPNMVMLSYKGAASDRLLLGVLSDAAVRGHDPALIAQVYYAYQCLPTTLTAPANGDLAARIRPAKPAKARCPTAAERRRWRVIKADNDLVDLRGKLLGAVRKGNVVRLVRGVRGWVQVRTWRGETGWIHDDQVRTYP